MYTLSGKGQKWLKAVHVFFACMWVGGGIALLLMQHFMSASTGGELYGINRSMRFVDDFVIIPGAFGSLITGLLFSLFTNWGFFKHNWIIVKWCINIYGILFGTFFLGPWLNSLGPISKELGMKALSDPTYVHNMTMNLYWSTFQVGTLVFAVFITALKPWKKKKAVG